jgi:hypothetical protein
MKFAPDRPYSDPEKAARKILEIANSVEPVQDGRIYIELINGPLLKEPGTPAEHRAGLNLAIRRGWLWMHESGTFVRSVRLVSNKTPPIASSRRGIVDVFKPPRQPQGGSLFERGRFEDCRDSEDRSLAVADVNHNASL